MPLPRAVIAALFVLIVSAGCAARQADPPRAATSALYRDMPAPVPGTPSDEAGRGIAAVPEPKGIITLRDAAALAIAHNPDLAAASWEVAAREAGTRQAGVRPNPALEFEAEEFGGPGERRRFEAAEVSVRLSQVLELGAKRAKRVRMASLDRNLSEWDREILRLDTLTGVAKAFIDVVAAQELHALARENLETAGALHSAAAERVKAGKVPPLEESRARAELAAARIESERTARELADARAALAASWGGTNPVFESARGSLEGIVPVPSVDAEKILASGPDMARLDAYVERQAAAVEVEKSHRIPDVTVTGGGMRFNDEGANAVVAGLSVPVPLFDRNRGNVDGERANLAKAREERRSGLVAAHVRVLGVLRELSSACAQASALSADVIPAAKSAFDAASEGYRAGKYSGLDVLEARRAYIAAKKEIIWALASYHKAAADIERLAGMPLEEIFTTTR